MSDVTTATTAGVQVAPTVLKWVDANGDNQTMQLFVVSEEHDRSSMVTEHPVEDGVAITDHVRPNLDQLVIDIFVTQTPITPDGLTLQHPTLKLPQQPTVNGRVFQGATEVTPAVYMAPSPKDYVAAAWSQFEVLRDDAVIIEIIFPRAYYPSMLLERVRMRRDRTSGLGAFMTLEFKQVRVVRASVADAPVPSVPTAIPEAKKGNVQPDVPKESVARAIQVAAEGHTP